MGWESHLWLGLFVGGWGWGQSGQVVGKGQSKDTPHNIPCCCITALTSTYKNMITTLFCWRNWWDGEFDVMRWDVSN